MSVAGRARRPPPEYVEQEFAACLKCGRLEHGFLRVRCEECHADKRVAFSCKKRGSCPSCGWRRMSETAALLAGELLPERPLRQWVLSAAMGSTGKTDAFVSYLLSIESRSSR